MKLELTEPELDGIIDVIDGTVGTILEDEEFDRTEVKFWFDILRKCGERGNELVQEYIDANTFLQDDFFG